MPRKIEIFDIEWQPYRDSFKIEEDMKTGFLAIAYPGKFSGFGQTPGEALIMVAARYRLAKKRFVATDVAFTSGGDITTIEERWVAFADNRQIKITAAQQKWGITESSTWNPDKIS
jgi:hypothetical protein